MVLKYNSESRWKDLLPVLNDHVEWFHDVMNCIFYPEDVSACYGIQKPVSFSKWVLKASEDPGIQPEVIKKLTALHRDLFITADSLIYEAQKMTAKPPYQFFKAFMTIYEEFLLGIRRLEKDFMEEDSGYDSFTGLRSSRLLLVDIDIELDRLARKGRSFTIAMARIDNFNEIRQYYSQQESNGFIKAISDLIKASIRSFDDAYYWGGDKFVLLLKQADIQGGITALDRLRRELEDHGIVHELGPRKKLMSMSCCIAEPLEGDNIKEILQSLKNELDSNLERREGTVLEYYEMSPLQRYVNEASKH